MERKLKLYTADLVDTIDGIVGISIVSEPANGRFFSVLEDNGDNMLVATPIMVANKPIYRNNDNYGEHYVIFTPDVIKTAMENATEKQATYTFDVEHSGDKIDGVTLVQSFIADYEYGITTFKGVPCITDGTWMGIFKITNGDIMEGIRDGIFKGVSVSMYATYEEVTLKDAIDMYNYLINIV